MSAKPPGIEKIGIEDVLADGQTLGADPATIANAVQKWHALTYNYGDSKIGTSDPEKFFKASDTLDAKTQETLHGLQTAARDQWWISNFNDPAEAQKFSDALVATNGDARAMSENDPAYEPLMQDYHTKVLANPAFSIPPATRQSQDIYSGSVPVATFRARQTATGLDALISTKDDKGNYVHGRVKIPTITDADVAAEQEKAIKLAATWEDSAAKARWSADQGLDALSDGASNYAADAERFSQRAEQAKLRLAALTDPKSDPKQMIAQERITEALGNSPLAKSLPGQLSVGNLAEDFQRGLIQFSNETLIGLNDLVGNKERVDELRALGQETESAYPGSVGARLRGGVPGFVSEAASAAGLMAPTVAIGLATGGKGPQASALSTAAARLAPLASMTPQLYGGAVSRTLGEADTLDQQAAEARRAGKTELADTLTARAQDFRENHRAYGVASTAAFIAPQFIFHANELFRAGEGALLPRIAKAAGAGGAEMGAVAALQGQIIDPGFGKERGTLGDMAHQMAMGALLAAPNPVLQALTKPRNAAGPAPAVAPAARGVTADATLPTPPTAGSGSIPDVAAPYVQPPNASTADAGLPEGPPTRADASLLQVDNTPIPTLPETPEALAAQRQRVADGSKPAMLFPDQSPEDVAANFNLNPDETLTETPEGTFLHKPDILAPEAILTASAEGRTGDILGYGVPDKPAGGSDTAIVHRDADGNEIAGVVATPDTAPQITETLQQQAQPGDTVAPEPILETLQLREDGTPRPPDGLRPQPTEAPRPPQEQGADAGMYRGEAPEAPKDSVPRPLDPLEQTFQSAVDAVSPEASVRNYKLPVAPATPEGVAEARRRQALPQEGGNGLQFSKASDPLYQEIDAKYQDDFARMLRGELPERQKLNLGPASDELKLAGFPEGPITVDPNTLRAKSTQENHPFPLMRLRTLSQALRDPIFVFKSGSHGNGRVALTDLAHGGENILVAVHFTPAQNGVEVSHIASIYPKNSTSILNWIREERTLYWHKQKGQAWLSRQDSEPNARQSRVHAGTLKNTPSNEDVKPGIPGPERSRHSGGASIPLAYAKDAAARLRESMPELVRHNVEFHDSVDSYLASETSQTRQTGHTEAEVEGMHGGEGFHDPSNGKSIIFLNQIEQRPGETARGAVARVILHERAGHEGVNFLLRTDPTFKAKWEAFTDKISASELSDLAVNGYGHLTRPELALEWLARKIDATAQTQGGFKVDGLRGVALQMWDTLKTWMNKALRRFSVGAQRDLQLRELITKAREAALSGRSAESAEPSSAGIQHSLASLKKNLGDLADNTKKIWEGLKDVPRFTPFKAAINGWVGRMQQSALAVRKLQEGIEARVKDPLRREAITNYLHAGGDMTLLAAWEGNSKGRLREGYKLAQQLTPDEIKLAEQIRGFYDSSGALAQKEGVLKGWQTDYVNKVWKDKFWSTKLTRDFVFGKKATNANFYEGEQKGLTPATKDISKLAGLYIHELHKTIATRQMIKDLTTKRAKDGRPLAAPLGGVMLGADTDAAATRSNLLVLPHAKGKVRFGPNGPDGKPNMVDISDYKRLNHPSLAKWRFLDTDEAGKTTMILGELALHPEIHAHLKNALGTSAIKEWVNQPANSRIGAVARKLLKTGDLMNGFIKQTMLSMSPFHIVQEGTHAVGHKVNPFYNIPRIDPDNPAHQDAMRHGLMLGGDEVAMQQFMEGNGKSPIMERIPGLGPIVKAISDFTFHTYIPGLKLKTYEHILQRNMQRFQPEIASGKLTEADVKYLSSTQTNNAYGHLNYKDIGRNPTFQHLLRLGMLAPDFLEARMKFTGDAALRGKVGTEQRIAMMTLATTFYVGARVLNAALNDGDMKFHEPFSVVVGNRAYAMRSVPEDIYKLFADSRRFLYGRLSPLIGHTVIEALTGLNYRGEKVKFSQTMEDTLLRTIPISIRAAPGLRELTQATKQNPISPMEQFVGSLGIQITRKSPITDMQKLAGDFAAANGQPSTGSFPLSPYRNLRFALEDLDTERAAAEIAELKARGITGDKLAKNFHQSIFQPWAGSKALQEKFTATLKGDDKILLDLANQRREDIWNRFQQITK